ncbi:hypothetical protein D3C78_997520 [compost metagenome]
MAWDGVQPHGGLRRRQQGITAVLRFGTGVRGNATVGDVQLAGGHKAVAAAHQLASCYAGANVHGGEEINVVHHAGFHHGFCATSAFFCRLENQFDGAVELRLQAFENVCQSQADGGVAIVTACMHHAAVAGGKTFAKR